MSPGLAALPALAAALALGLGEFLMALSGGAAARPLLPPLIAIALLAGLPACFRAAATDDVTGLPAGVAAWGALILTLALLRLGFGASWPLAASGAVAAGAIAALLALLGGLLSREALPAALAPLSAGLLVALLPAILIGGGSGTLCGLATAAGIAAMLIGIPRLGGSAPRGEGWAEAGIGLLAALSIIGFGVAGTGPALLAALPGLLLLAAWRGVAGLRLGTALLVLQGATGVLVLAMGAAPAASGMVAPEALPAFRLGALGGLFLPALAALCATPGEGWMRLAACSVLLALACTALLPVIGPAAALAGPVLATALAGALGARRAA